MNYTKKKQKIQSTMVIAQCIYVQFLEKTNNEDDFAVLLRVNLGFLKGVGRIFKKKTERPS